MDKMREYSRGGTQPARVPLGEVRNRGSPNRPVGVAPAPSRMSGEHEECPTGEPPGGVPFWGSQMVTIAETAQITGLSPKAVARCIWRGELRSVHLRAWRLVLERLERQSAELSEHRRITAQAESRAQAAERVECELEAALQAERARAARATAEAKEAERLRAQLAESEAERGRQAKALARAAERAGRSVWGRLAARILGLSELLAPGHEKQTP